MCVDAGGQPRRGPLAGNMEDLPAVEPVKIYENTYRLEPADTEK